MTPLAASAIRENSKDGVFNIYLKDGIIDPLNTPVFPEGGASAQIFFAQNPLTLSPLLVKRSRDNVPPEERGSHPMTREFKFLSGPLKGAPHSAGVRGICYSQKKIELIMARINGLDLHDICTEQPHLFNVSTCMNIAQQTLEYFQFSHSKGVAHGDVKLENCLFKPETGELTIIDIGAAFLPGQESAKNGGACTLASLSPEDLMNAKNVGCKIDIWALGVMLVSLYTKALMFGVDGDGASPFLKQDLLASFGRQFPADCSKSLGIQHLQKKYRASRSQIKQMYTSEKLQELGQKDIPDLPPKMHPWYKMPWRDRIELIAREKNEPQEAPKLIALLEKMFVFDPDERISAEEGLLFLAKLRGESAASADDALLPMEALDLGPPAVPALEQERKEDPNLI